MLGDIGTVGALWRYPVKSMLGEQISTARVTERGPPGDRGLALIDQETGKIASAKNPRLWRALLTCQAALVDAAVRTEHNRIHPLDDWTPGPCVGVYAQILRPGTIRTGDAVRL